MLKKWYILHDLWTRAPIYCFGEEVIGGAASAILTSANRCFACKWNKKSLLFAGITSLLLISDFWIAKHSIIG